MDVYFLAKIINIIAQAIVLLVIVSVILSYVMSPYHPVRQAIDRIVNPMLVPLRRIIPLLGMIDLSPLVLIILVQVIATGIINLLYAYALR